jgi:hypothetical protein
VRRQGQKVGFSSFARRNATSKADTAKTSPKKIADVQVGWIHGS